MYLGVCTLRNGLVPFHTHLFQQIHFYPMCLRNSLFTLSARQLLLDFWETPCFHVPEGLVLLRYTSAASLGALGSFRAKFWGLHLELLSAALLHLRKCWHPYKSCPYFSFFFLVNTFFLLEHLIQNFLESISSHFLFWYVQFLTESEKIGSRGSIFLLLVLCLSGAECKGHPILTVLKE